MLLPCGRISVEYVQILLCVCYFHRCSSSRYALSFLTAGSEFNINLVSAHLYDESRRNLSLACLFALLLQSGCASSPGYVVHTNDAAELESAARASFRSLVEGNDEAKQLAKDASGVMIFPRILKAGLTFGGQFGEGVLLEDDQVAGYFNSVSASFGLQAGAQRFGYALIITNEEALEQVKHARGWELGIGPSLVIADRGLGKSLTTTTIRSDIYAFVFDQKGLMVGSGLQGTKVSPIVRN